MAKPGGLIETNTLAYCTKAEITSAQFFVAKIASSVSTMLKPGNTKGGSITVPLTSCLTGLELAV